MAGNNILFDAGENGSWLLENMQSLKTGIDDIEAIAISHDHWDHTGGLWKLLEKKQGLTVYACPNFSMEFKKKVKKFKGKLIEVEKVTEIAENIFATGEIAGEYKGEYMSEQALVIKTDKGISVITGCAHPGIIKILHTVKKNFPNGDIYAVLGGFHLINKDERDIGIIADEFRKIGVAKAGPTHCSGKEAEEIFENKYGQDFLSIKTGLTLNI